MAKTSNPRTNSNAKSAKPASTEARNTDDAHKWTFFTNHAHVLILLHASPDIVLREIAVEVGITERAVQRIVQDLETGGFIERERIGRRNRYHVQKNRNLRHPIEAHCTIDKLISVIVNSK